MKLFFQYIKKRPLGLISIIVLLILYLGMIFAEFIAPYSPTQSFEQYTYSPPNVSFTPGRAGGLFQIQERGLINPLAWRYARIKDSYTPISFFVETEPYRLAGLIPMKHKLFGTADGTPVFLFGADHLGRDLFSRVVYGSRISLTIGFIATLISLSLAIVFGGIAGYYGGRTDWIIMRLAEFFMLIPGLYLILFLRSLLSSKMDTGQAYMIITVILALVGWPSLARTIRGMVHSIKREEFILNAELECVPSFQIIFRHIIPQTASLLIISIALSIPLFILSETTLSYLGLGISDPAVSWGSLINRDISTITNLKNFPWLLNPVWLLLTVTLAFNFLADCIRDFFDPYHIMRRPFSFSFFSKKKTQTGGAA